jgi:hypothetical protein
MSIVSKPRQTISVVIRGRKLKGQKIGREATFPLKICERLGIEPGDMVELRIEKVTKAPQAEGDEIGA